MQEEKPKIITKETIRRLTKDIQEIIKNPLTEHGIHYKHDEEDILKGYAMIVGPEGTPYFGGFYFFVFDFPCDYPHSPPLVTYCTNGDNIRFNPNLYKDGKVCISLLNTWRGEQWTSCQTLNTVLLNLCTLLNNEPLLNEPGVSKKHPDFHVYNKIIEYKNVDIAILKMIQKVVPFYNVVFDVFDDFVKEQFLKNADAIWKDLDKKKLRPKEYLQTVYYKMHVQIDHNKLYKDFTDYYNTIRGILNLDLIIVEEEKNLVVLKKRSRKKLSYTKDEV
jgi:ubiquitin-conjugating enzyme E2 Z